MRLATDPPRSTTPPNPTRRPTSTQLDAEAGIEASAAPSPLSRRRTGELRASDLNHSLYFLDSDAEFSLGV